MHVLMFFFLYFGCFSGGGGIWDSGGIPLEIAGNNTDVYGVSYQTPVVYIIIIIYYYYYYYYYY